MSQSKSINDLSPDEVRKAVRDNYGQVALRTGSEGGCCGTTTSGCGTSTGCCGPSVDPRSADDVSAGLGYGPDELSSVPEGANLGLGCGNPQAIAAIQPGEVV